jgi:GAF domain-containing protein
VGLALGSTLDLDQLLELILKKITEVLEADRATLYLLDEQRKRLVSRIMIGEEARSIELRSARASRGTSPRRAAPLRVEGRLQGQALPPRVGRAHGLPHALHPRGAHEEPRGPHHRRHPGAQQKRSDEKTRAQIQARHDKAASSDPGATLGEFSADDEELLTALATQAAISIDNSRLFLSVIQKNMQLVDTKEQLEHRVATSSCSSISRARWGARPRSRGSRPP